MWLTSAAKSIALLLLLVICLAIWAFFIVWTGRIQQPIDCAHRRIIIGESVYQAMSDEEYQEYCK